MSISLNKPTVGSTDWGGDVNDNFATIENCFNGSESVGPIGIGTSTPGQDLEVKDGVAYFWQTGSSEQVNLELGSYSDSGYLYQIKSTDAATSTIEIYARRHGSNFKFTRHIDSDSPNIALLYGASGQASRFDLYGSDGATVSVRLSTGGDSYLNGGDVGVGTSSPSEKLDVDGNVNVSSGNVYKVNSTQVVGSQQSAISDPAESVAANNAAIDSILASLRAHGLIATS